MPKIKEEKPKSWRPDNWDKMAHKDRGKWFREHRTDIEKDITELGHLEARRLWGMPHSTMRQLRKKWGLLEAAVTNKPKRVQPLICKTDSIQEKGKMVGMPPFPEFDNNWSVLVQEKWLEVYKEIYLKEK